MKLKLLMKTARNAVIEILDGGIYYSEETYKIYVNDRYYGDTKETISSIYGLKPNTHYQIQVVGKVNQDAVDMVTDYEFVTLDVKDFGAKGDGVQNDTLFIQAAIMACPKDGRVFIPQGHYRITSLFLKSNIRIELAEGAVLSAETDRDLYPKYPGLIESYDEKEEYNLGTWEGNPLLMYTGVITGVHVDNVILYGKGMINGNASQDDWWFNPKVMRGAFRPRLLFLNKCSNITVEGIKFCNSPSWTIHPYFSENLSFYHLDIDNPHDSPNTDGLDPESCENVNIIGTRFSLGDDCIAIKSGKIYMGSKYKKPSENITIKQCLMENGHGAVTIGSEMAGGVKNVHVEECLFKKTDRGLRVKTRRGRGKDAILDEIVFKHIKMDHVMTPFVVNCFYFCDPDGKSEYVQSKDIYPVDERTPVIKKLAFHHIICKNCHNAAAFFYGLPEMKIECIDMKDVQVEFAREPKEGVPAMLCGADSCIKRGLYANNVGRLILDDVIIKGQIGQAFETSHVTELQVGKKECR